MRLTGLVWRWALRGRGLCAETWTSSGSQPGGGKGRAFSSKGAALQSPRGGRELEESPSEGAQSQGERGKAEMRERGRAWCWTGRSRKVRAGCISLLVPRTPPSSSWDPSIRETPEALTNHPQYGEVHGLLLHTTRPLSYTLPSGGAI